MTISGPGSPKVRFSGLRGRNVVDFVEKVTISVSWDPLSDGLWRGQSAFPSFPTQHARAKGVGFQNRPFFGSVWPDFSEKMTISGPGSPKVRFSGLGSKCRRFRRKSDDFGVWRVKSDTFGWSGHRYFDLQGVKSRRFGGSFSLACSVPQRFGPPQIVTDLGRQDPRSTLRTSKCVTFRPRFGNILPPADTRAQTGVFWGVKTLACSVPQRGQTGGLEKKRSILYEARSRVPRGSPGHPDRRAHLSLRFARNSWSPSSIEGPSHHPRSDVDERLRLRTRYARYLLLNCFCAHQLHPCLST